jgi:hypothetical protein
MDENIHMRTITLHRSHEHGWTSLMKSYQTIYPSPLCLEDLNVTVYWDGGNDSFELERIHCSFNPKIQESEFVLNQVVVLSLTKFIEKNNNVYASN